MSKHLRYPSRRLTLIVGTVALVGAIGLLLLPGFVNGSTLPAVCKQTLGPQWEIVGVIDAPGLDHYDVRCERDTGLLSKETRWVTVPRSEYTFMSGWEQITRFYRGVFGL